MRFVGKRLFVGVIVLGTLIVACSKRDKNSGDGRTGTTPGALVSNGPPPTACTAAPCTTSGPNSARCAGSPNGVCTPTEALIMNYDIQKNSQGPGAPTAHGCYMCMVKNACLDADSKTNGLGSAVTNAECGDPDPAAAQVNPPFVSRNVSQRDVPVCLDLLNCLLTGNGGAEPHCATSGHPPASGGNCFCGPHRGSACIADSSSPAGVCATKEFAALGTTEPKVVLVKFVDTSFSPGGIANAALNCALVATPSGACTGRPCFK